MINLRLEEFKIVVFGKASTQKSVLQSSNSWGEAFSVEYPSYQRNIQGIRVIQPCGCSKMGFGLVWFV